jgi:hypothetical protein
MKFIFLFFFIENIFGSVLKPNSRDYSSLTAEEFTEVSAKNDLSPELQKQLFLKHENEELSWYLHRPSEISFIQRTFDRRVSDLFARKIDSAGLRPVFLAWLKSFLIKNPDLIPENLRHRAEGKDFSEYINFDWTMAPVFFHPRKRLSFMITVTAFGKPFLVFARAVYFTKSQTFVLEMHCPFKERLRRVFEEICAHFQVEEPAVPEKTGLLKAHGFRSEDFLRVFLLPPMPEFEFNDMLKENNSSLLEHSGKLGLFVLFSSVLFFLFLPGRK